MVIMDFAAPHISAERVFEYGVPGIPGPVYEDDKDREEFLKVLATVAESFQRLCLAHCLTGNHHHLLIEMPEPTLARGTRQPDGV